MFHLYD